MPFGRSAAEQLLLQRFDVTALATILRAQAGTDDQFASIVRDALYKDFTYAPALTEARHAEYACHIRDTNPTLHAVGTMCGVKLADSTYAPNSTVRAIVTLNMDALLQMYTRARFGARVLRTTERASASSSKDKIHCYHLHGYMVRDVTRTSRPRSRESPDRLILTEQQYFDVVANVHGFVNYTLLHLLREYRFLFIWLSMSDPNLRRALHLSYRERVRELRDEGNRLDDAEKRSTRHWAVMREEAPEVNSATATLLRVIGVEPIWVKGYGEIPVILKTLYESIGGSWGDVA